MTIMYSDYQTLNIFTEKEKLTVSRNWPDESIIIEPSDETYVASSKMMLEQLDIHIGKIWPLTSIL